MEVVSHPRAGHASPLVQPGRLPQALAADSSAKYGFQGILLSHHPRLRAKVRSQKTCKSRHISDIYCSDIRKTHNQIILDITESGLPVQEKSQKDGGIPQTL